jgi:pimeloyl-ACP methyl ester carboxylesterase
MKNTCLSLFSCLITLGSFAQKHAYTHVNEVLTLGEDSIHYAHAFDENNHQYDKLVVFIPGSGPTDRDGNSLLTSTKGNTFLFLADSLSKHGIASLRYDKPGVGKSTLKGGETKLRFELNAEVVKALVNKYQSTYKHIYLAGHSEGSLVGLLAAQDLKLAGFISMAGAARNAADVLSSQLNASPSLSNELKAESTANLDSLKQGYTVKQYNMMLASIFRAGVQPYLMSWFKYTPTEEIAKLKIPVLIIQGQQDIQVPAAAGEALDHYAQNSTLKIYPNMNHVLKDVNSEEENRRSYGDASISLCAPMVKDLINWVNAH